MITLHKAFMKVVFPGKGWHSLEYLTQNSQSFAMTGKSWTSLEGVAAKSWQGFLHAKSLRHVFFWDENLELCFNIWKRTLQGTNPYPTLGKGKSSSNIPFVGYVSSQEGKCKCRVHCFLMNIFDI